MIASYHLDGVVNRKKTPSKIYGNGNGCLGQRGHMTRLSIARWESMPREAIVRVVKEGHGPISPLLPGRGRTGTGASFSIPIGQEVDGRRSSETRGLSLLAIKV